MNSQSSVTTERDHAQLSRAMVTAFKLINTFYGASFIRFITSSAIHPDFDGANIHVIAEKNRAAMQRCYTSRAGSTTLEEARALLSDEAKRLDIKLTSKEKKGQLKALSVLEADDVQQLIYAIAENGYSHGVNQRASFDTREVLYETCQFLVARTTIANGFTNTGLHAIFVDMLKQKSTDFFKSGYLCDLFYSAQLNLSKRSHQLAIHRDWLNVECLPVGNLNTNEARIAQDRDLFTIPATH